MWRTYNESGTLAYSFVESMVAMHPYYIMRTIGGLLFFIGTVIGCYNIWMTIRTASVTTQQQELNHSAASACPVLQPGE